MIVAALFVQEDGCYIRNPSIDAWPISRDARLYSGPHPVIAHPPCQLWGALAFVNFARWGGEHNRPENDGGCFESALKAVKTWGGVLEHPAKSRAWKKYGLVKPTKRGWQPSGQGWTCEVWQSAYGHRANKATWLFYSGERKPFDLNWSRVKGPCQVGCPDRRGKFLNKPTLSKREANATPKHFQHTLIRLANHSRPMRHILKEVERLYQINFAQCPKPSFHKPVGASGMEYKIRAEALAELKMLLGKDIDFLIAINQVKQFASNLVRIHNKQRTDINWQLWEGTANETLETVERFVADPMNDPMFN
jgi:hypothetical protein